VPVQGCTLLLPRACTEPQCLYKGALYFYLGPVQSLSACTRVHITFTLGLYRASVPVQGCTLPFNPSGSIKALGWAQPLTEMSTRNIRTALFCVITQRVVVILYRILRNDQSVPSSTTTRCITTQKSAGLI